jgi:signal transduction histidine kinase
MKTEFHLPLSVVTGSAIARRLVERAFAGRRHHAQLEDALIVTTELVENALRHTPPGSHLRLCVRPGVARIEVTDRSVAAPIVRSSGYAGAGGRGMRLVQAIARRWGVERTTDGKVVWAELETR